MQPGSLKDVCVCVCQCQCSQSVVAQRLICIYYISEYTYTEINIIIRAAKTL